MKVKFCGMTNAEDVSAAVELGVDFVGFVFYEKSKRFVTYEQVRTITESINSDIKKVGVFVEQSNEEIKKAVEFCNLDYAQVYKTVEGVDTIRVYRIKDEPPKDISDGLILFDSYTKSIGGSGVSFDLSLLKNFEHKNRLFVAGGINIDNVTFIAQLNVFGVDLVSSIEAYPGKKDIKKMEDFMKVVRGL